MCVCIYAASLANCSSDRPCNQKKLFNERRAQYPKSARLAIQTYRKNTQPQKEEEEA